MSTTSPAWQRIGAGGATALALASAALGAIQFTEQTESAQLVALHDPQQTSSPWTVGGLGGGDFDRDGDEDVFVINGGLGPDHLFINDGTGTFSDEAASWGLTDVHCGSGVAVGDYDDDGWLDIYVTSMGDPDQPDTAGANRLYRNTGNGGFTEVAVAAGANVASPTSPFVYGASFGDYDLDGDLDLFVCTWQPGVDGNRLYRNDDNGTFTNVTDAAIGEAVLFAVHGFQSNFADMDGDLFPELLIAADFETSRYLANNGDGSFANLTIPAGTGLDDNGMGQTVLDYDNDGRFDWYVTSIFNDSPPPGNYPGNTLYHAVGAHEFVDIAEESGCKDGGWGWGTISLDVDQDGWEDIIEVNGRETTPPGQWTMEQAYLFHNDRDGTFTEKALDVGLDFMASGRAIAWLDAEGDGDLDVVIFSNSDALRYYRNDSAGGNWLQLAFDTSTNHYLAPDGFGTRVEVTAGGQTMMRFMDSHPSYLGTSQLVTHFGLGDATVADEVRIFWSRGHVTTLSDVPANQKLFVEAPTVPDIVGDGEIDVADLVRLILAWGPVTDYANQLAADFNDDGLVDVQDLVTLIVSWGEVR